jgi:hypothetical protein
MVSHETTIDLPDGHAERLLSQHLAASVPLFFERARIAAASSLRVPRQTSSKRSSVRIQMISMKQEKPTIQD